ncbi:MAG: hypothetical protein Kow0020_11650 [Wenzhouxiangellaceae bacterium]
MSQIEQHGSKRIRDGDRRTDPVQREQIEHTLCQCATHRNHRSSHCESDDGGHASVEDRHLLCSIACQASDPFPQRGIPPEWISAPLE